MSPQPGMLPVLTEVDLQLSTIQTMLPPGGGAKGTTGREVLFKQTPRGTKYAVSKEVSENTP